MMKICPDCGTPSMTSRCAHCGAELSSSALGGRAVLLGLGLALGSTACISEADYGTPDTGFMDADGDGYGMTEDCDDDDAARHPDAEETAGDGVDSNCDGQDDT